jgi:hypothetical protein
MPAKLRRAECVFMESPSKQAKQETRSARGLCHAGIKEF